MADQSWMTWDHQPPIAARGTRQLETIFTFTRASDGTTMTCGLRFNGELFGWEAMFRDGGGFVIARGGFATRGQALQWAKDEHAAHRRDGWTDFVNAADS